jgi:hypothetical protein
VGSDGARPAVGKANKDFPVAYILVRVPGIDVGAALDQQLYNVEVQEIRAGRIHQRSSAEGIESVDVGAVSQRNAGLVGVRGGPHEGRGVGVISLIRIGAKLEETLQRGFAGIQHRVHEWSGTLLSTGVEELGIFGDGLHEPGEIGGA